MSLFYPTILCIYIQTPMLSYYIKKNWVKKFGGEVGGRCANYERHK